MAKVKSTKDGLQAGTAGSAKKSLSGQSKSVIAVKDGNTRTFSRLTWDFLPPDKNGWVLSSETPDEPIIKKLNSDNSDNDDTDQSLLDARAEYTNVFGATPIETLTADELLSAINEKTQSDLDELTKGLTEKELTQEDLDLNGEWAKAGKKVGDVVFVTADGALVEKPVTPVTTESKPPVTQTEKKAVTPAKAAKPKAAKKVVTKASKGGTGNGENA